MSRKQTKISQPELTFDVALERLEKLVEEMEHGELPLEAAMEKYAEGAALSQLCLVQLKAAEQAVNKVIKESGGKLSEADLILPEAD